MSENEKTVQAFGLSWTGKPSTAIKGLPYLFRAFVGDQNGVGVSLWCYGPEGGPLERYTGDYDGYRACGCYCGKPVGGGRYARTQRGLRAILKRARGDVETFLGEQPVLARRFQAEAEARQAKAAEVERLTRGISGGK